eukprot:m.359443 g.359443  ORF g.359443 m.359443 type:complete len:246 (-) comp18570_c0_seq1:340-1077(-)
MNHLISHAARLVSRSSVFVSNVRSLSTGGHLGAKHLIIIGPPGGGKGTISKWITNDFGLDVLGTGDMIRSEIDSGSELGEQVREIVGQGGLVGDDIMVDLVSNVLSEKKTQDWMLDGFPRSVKQAEALDDTVPISAVLHIDVPFETIVERLQDRLYHPGSGRIYHRQFNPPKQEGVDDETGEPLVVREDDKPEVIRARLEQYASITQPVIDHYQALGLVQRFPGTLSKEIYGDAKKFLDGLFDSK